MVTGWLKEREVEGTLQIDDLVLGGAHLFGFQIGRVQFFGAQPHAVRARRAGFVAILARECDLPRLSLDPIQHQRARHRFARARRSTAADRPAPARPVAHRSARGVRSNRLWTRRGCSAARRSIAPTRSVPETAPPPAPPGRAADCTFIASAEIARSSVSWSIA